MLIYLKNLQNIPLKPLVVKDLGELTNNSNLSSSLDNSSKDK